MMHHFGFIEGVPCNLALRKKTELEWPFFDENVWRASKMGDKRRH